jgi:hypothetical protein
MGKKVPLEIDERFWAKTVKSAIGNNPIRILVEIIMNSADSYQRLSQAKLAKPPHKIWVKYFRPLRYVGVIEVGDEAEGMTAEQLWRALRYGAATSGLKEGLMVRGVMGIGLKDACMAMRESTIISIRNGRLSEFKLLMEKGKPYVEMVRENQPVSKKERVKLGLKNNGTIVKGFLPRNFPRLKSDQVIDRLKRHFMMRRLLQLADYEVLFTRSASPEPARRLKYVPPIGRILKQDESELQYGSLGKFKIRITVRKTNKNLTVTGEYREAGLIHYHDNYAVADCTLWGFDNDPLARSLFGEVEIIGFSRFLKRDEDVIDEKRRGLNRKHPFIDRLVREIENRLRLVIEEERRKILAEYSLDKENLKKTLRELNRIAKEEGALGRFMLPPPEYWTESISFYPPHVEVFEYLEKKVHLVINPNIIKPSSLVCITSDHDEIDVHPEQLSISEPKPGENRCFLREIRILARGSEIEGEIGALANGFLTTAHVKAYRNPMLYPENGFAFVPAETKIVEGNRKNANLMVETHTLRQTQPPVNIQLESSNSHIQCANELQIPENVDPYLLSPKVARIQVPVKATRASEKGWVIARLGEKEARLHVGTVSPFEKHGLFKEIRFTSSEDVKEISYFNRDDGIVYVYSKHPLMKKYMHRTNFKRDVAFLAFAADTIARLICWEITKEKERKGSLEILNPENKLQELRIHVNEIYYKRGAKLHDVLTSLIKTLKISR